MATLYHNPHELSLMNSWSSCLVCCTQYCSSPVEMVSILSEYVHESIIVGLTLGQANGCRVEVLLEQCLQLCFCVILIKTNQLVEVKRRRRRRERGRGRQGEKDKRESSRSHKTHPPILEQHVEGAPLTDHIHHPGIEGVLVG